VGVVGTVEGEEVDVVERGEIGTMSWGLRGEDSGEEVGEELGDLPIKKPQINTFGHKSTIIKY
jgi:hypothetical protein